MYNIRVFYRLRELFEADFYEPGIHGSGWVWENAWDVFHRTSSRSGHRRRATVESWCVFNAVGFRVSIIIWLFRTQTARRKYNAALPHLPLYQ